MKHPVKHTIINNNRIKNRTVMKRNLHIVWHTLLGLAAIAGFGAAVMLLWNALLPQIFGIAAVNFWQALGLLALCRLLFGSFGGGRPFGRGMGHKNPIREKWMSMTPEEREEFIKNHHFGHSFGRFVP
jgi:predicted ferric reductase